MENIEVIVDFFDGICVSVIGEGVISLLYVQEALSLNGALEELGICCGISQFFIMDDTGIILFLNVISIELLVLTIRADNASQEGEQEHRDQYDHTCYCQSVSEESLGDQSTGRKDLDTSVVIQRIVFVVCFSLALCLGGFFDFFFTHDPAPPLSDSYSRVNNRIENICDQISEKCQYCSEYHEKHGERNIT